LRLKVEGKENVGIIVLSETLNILNQTKRIKANSNVSPEPEHFAIKAYVSRVGKFPPFLDVDS
jgi:hypothetical protein